MADKNNDDAGRISDEQLKAIAEDDYDIMHEIEDYQIKAMVVELIELRRGPMNTQPDDAAVEELAKELHRYGYECTGSPWEADRWLNAESGSKQLLRDKARAVLARFGEPSPVVSEEMIETFLKAANAHMCNEAWWPDEWANMKDSEKAECIRWAKTGFAAIGLIPPKPGPAQVKPEPEKVCRWTKKDGEYIFHIGCRENAGWSSVPAFPRCPYCGLPISRETVKPEPTPGEKFAEEYLKSTVNFPASYKRSLIALYDAELAMALAARTEACAKVVEDKIILSADWRPIALRKKLADAIRRLAALELRGEASHA